jgi:hypothetical protein
LWSKLPVFKQFFLKRGETANFTSGTFVVLVLILQIQPCKASGMGIPIFMRLNDQNILIDLCLALTLLL